MTKARALTAALLSAFSRKLTSLGIAASIAATVAAVVPASAAGASDYAVRIKYDALRRPVEQFTPDYESRIVTKYNANGWVTFIYSYDAKNTSAIGDDVLLQKTETLYYAGGQVKETRAQGCFAYPSGALQLTHADCAVTTSTYDAAGRPDVVTDPLGRKVKTEYFADGQVDKLIQAYGTAIAQDYQSYTYSPNGQVASVKDAGRNVTTYSYDGFDRLIRTDFPSDAACTQTGDNSTCLNADNLPDGSDYDENFYDANGNLIRKHTRKRETIRFAYDALNRQVRKYLNSYIVTSDIQPGCWAANPNPTVEVCTTYDLADRVKEVKFPTTAAITNSYDSAGRLDTVNDNGRTISYAYDAASNRTQITYPGGAGSATTGGASSGAEVVNYSYDALGRMDMVAGTMAIYSYDALSRRSQLTNAHGRITNYAYHTDNMPLSLSHDVAGTNDDVTYSFGFDKANQMVSRTISNDLYSWSPDTNSSETYSRNGLNQYSTVSANAYKYDGNGSLTDTHDGTVNDGWAYAYDVENRLTSATNKANGQVTTYDYDPMGRLYSQNNNGVVTSYLYDGVEPIQDYNVSGVIIRRFFNGAGVDERVAYKTYDGVTSALTSHKYYMADHQGSVIGISQSCCNNAYAKQAYGEFGVPESGNMGDQPFGYTGRRYDADTGLYYYRARFYKADLGRFLQTDPIGYEDQMNLYTYVANNPMMGIDPFGLAGCDVDAVFCGLFESIMGAFGGGKSIEQQVTSEFASGGQNNSDFNNTDASGLDDNAKNAVSVMVAGKIAGEVNGAKEVILAVAGTKGTSTVGKQLIKDLAPKILTRSEMLAKELSKAILKAPLNSKVSTPTAKIISKMPNGQQARIGTPNMTPLPNAKPGPKTPGQKIVVRLGEIFDLLSNLGVNSPVN